ncbi:M20/M25/M40 family metallo-hydrolase [Halomarina pelagica]|uniref:M20/M25/M40 family metallo-hydrolase n=1 Tax=Halomarina pelagica TaxID=2961599 RepID=UPI0020C40759|nr:M20/M25/M40 family metallo-hydrolase [Halomarina sp. BND7]
MGEIDPLSFHERAVRTPSHESVDDMRDLLVEALREAGEAPRVDAAGNVLAAKGEGRPHLVLNTHLDTVPPHVPFGRSAAVPGADAGGSGERGAGGDGDDGGSGDGARASSGAGAAGDVVLGRGACDAKGPLAAMVAAFAAAPPDGPRLTLAVTPDEETTSAGAAALAPTLDGDLYVVGEPTGLDVCTAARGRFEGSISIRGVAAHAAEPETGVNAVAAAEAVLGALRTFDGARGPDPHPELGAPTLTPTRIRGGEAINQVPDSCRVDVDRRSVPPETAAGFERALNDHLAPLDADCEFSLTERETPFLEAFATDPGHPLVAALRGAGAGEARPFGAATEASYFAPEPTVVFGPGALADEEGPVAHARREYVRRSEVERAGEILREAVTTLRG